MANDLSTLMASLREAREGSRELDRDIYEFAIKGRTERVKRDVIAGPYTTDLTAAVALLERVLPGSEFGLDVGYHNEERICSAYVGDAKPRDDNDYWSFTSRGATPALALCLAVLIAKEKAP